MLIVYRTNEEFIGHIVSLNRQQSLVEFEAWRTSTQPTPEMAAIVVDESLLRGELLADLATNAAAYRVAGGALTLDGTPVDLGYEPSATGAVERMRSDTDMVALFDMDETALLHGWQRRRRRISTCWFGERCASWRSGESGSSVAPRVIRLIVRVLFTRG